MRVISEPLSGSTALIFSSLEDLDCHIDNLKMMRENEKNIYILRPKIELGDKPLENAANQFGDELKEKFGLENV